MAENDLLEGESVLKNPEDFPAYHSDEFFRAGVTRVFDDLVVFNDTIFDASAVGALLQPVCELYGGNFYLYEVEATCGDSPFLDRSPYCTGASCNVSQLLETYTSIFFEDCNITNERLLASEPILKDECATTTSALMAQQPGDAGSFGIGDPNFLFYEITFNDYCEPVDNGGNQVCNFTSFQDDLLIRCEARGGYLYQVTDTYGEINYGEFDTIVSNATTRTVGHPFCISQACDGDDFIQDIIIPYFFYYFNSTTIDAYENETTLEPTKVTEQGFITIESISPISNVNPGESATVSTTASPTATPPAGTLSPIVNQTQKVSETKAPTVTPPVSASMESTALASLLFVGLVGITVM